MEWLFGRKKTPEELLRQNQRILNKAIRDLDRERTKMEGQVSVNSFQAKGNRNNRVAFSGEEIDSRYQEGCEREPDGHSEDHGQGSGQDS